MMSEIFDDFCEEEPSQQVYMLTGIRGSGKTVLLTEISDRFRKEDDWIVIDLNARGHLMNDLAEKLCSEQALSELFKRSKINLSLFGLGVEIDNTVPVANIETAVGKMLESIKKHGKKLLITIDEVTNSDEMAAFAGSFQIFVRRSLPVFLIMTGLYENIDALQNDQSLTFLYRAARMELGALNTGIITSNYEKVFHIPREKAREMSKLTRGYPYAFQALGYYTWENDGDYTAAMDQYKQLLDERAYEKLWSELSEGDRRTAYGIAASKTGKLEEIRAILDLKPNAINQYRKRLIRRGIVNGERRGELRFTLPLFESFVLDNYEE